VQASGNCFSHDARHLRISNESRASHHPRNLEILNRNEIKLVYEFSTQLMRCISSLVCNLSMQFGHSFGAMTTAI
jgi:hypothetical protein